MQLNQSRLHIDTISAQLHHRQYLYNEAHKIIFALSDEHDCGELVFEVRLRDVDVGFGMREVSCSVTNKSAAEAIRHFREQTDIHKNLCLFLKRKRDVHHSEIWILLGPEDAEKLGVTDAKSVILPYSDGPSEQVFGMEPSVTLWLQGK